MTPAIVEFYKTDWIDPMTLTRRHILSGLAALPLFACARAGSDNGRAKRRMVITIDDFNLNRPIGATAKTDDAEIRAALKAFGITAIAFPSMRWAETSDVASILETWSADGHIIGNHTFSHERAGNMGAQPFLDDILKNEAFLKDLPTYQKLLRFPYLNEGGTIETRDAIRAGLTRLGYRNVPVTIDAVDWAVSSRFSKHLSANTLPKMARYKDFYLEHTLAMAAYYDDVAKALGHVGMVHTLLIHHNVLNAQFLGDLLGALAQDGWQFEHPDAALAELVLTLQPAPVNPGWSMLADLQIEAKAAGDYTPLQWPERAQKFAGPAMDAAGL